MVTVWITGNRTAMVDEQMLFFEGSNGRLFGVLHEPADPATKTGFVFCHPFAEEKLWTHRVFVHFARSLAGRGFSVLRFDHFGHGDSDGEHADLSMTTMGSDIEAACKELRTRCPSLNRHVLLGLRLGASTAIHAAANCNADAVVAWEPVIDGSRYAQELLRSNLAGQMAAYGEVRLNREELVSCLKDGHTVNIDGYEIGNALHREMVEMNLLALSDSMLTVPWLIVNVRKGGNEAAPAMLKLAEQDPTRRLMVANEEPFWREIRQFYQRAPNLFASTESWIESELH